MSGQTHERRRAPRASADFPIQIGSDGTSGRVKNVSESGLACLTPRPLDEMTQVRLRMQLPGEETEHTVDGAIVWCSERAEESPPMFEVGVFFTAIEDDTRQALRSFVVNVLGRS